ncbi:hypothetical protein KFU94_23835 [Chloroflexi bacterium TSY]|nr:hypothetical protein [Chloroflexi bacterium TSY]
MEPLAGLAQLAYISNDLEEAQRLAEEILAYIFVHNLNHTEDAFQVYLTCYRVLCMIQDARASQVLEIAHEQLQHRAASLQTNEQKELFWKMAEHQEVLEAYRQR